MNVLDNIRLHYDTLTKKDKEIADYILEYPKKFCRQDMNDFTKKLSISKSALIRFAKKLGYSGYSELRYELSRIIFTGSHQTLDEQLPAQVITQGYITCLMALSEQLNQSLIETIANKILSARKIKVFGYNDSALPLQHLSLRGTLLDIDFMVYSHRDYFASQMKLLGSDDLIIIYSVKDNAKIYQALLSQTHTPVLLVTMNPERFQNCSIKYMMALPNPAALGVGLLDEQLLFYVFNEVLLAQLMKEKNRRGGSLV